MKEIVVISGKGGTGKTSVVASFIKLASEKGKIITVDCDVDAADLHLILEPRKVIEYKFVSGHEAMIEPSECISCGKCWGLCKFDAIEKFGNDSYKVTASSCEGCRVCVHFCPVQAIRFRERYCGDWYISDTRFGTFLHAQLGPGAENSGKLVSLLREEARKKACLEAVETIIIDGSPGIGCPVIASITGASAVVIVTEPSLSGLHDLERVAELVNHFRCQLFVCINKWDINPEITRQMGKKTLKYHATMLGTINYDEEITSAQVSGLSIIEYTESNTTKQIKNIWEKLCQLTANSKKR